MRRPCSSPQQRLPLVFGLLLAMHMMAIPVFIGLSAIGRTGIGSLDFGIPWLDSGPMLFTVFPDWFVVSTALFFGLAITSSVWPTFQRHSTE